MKTIKKISALLFMLAGILLKTSIVLSQCIDIIPLGGPPRYEVQTPPTYFFTVTNGSANCGTPATGAATMPGMGINIVPPNTPQYMLDILCDPSVPTNMDVNISSLAYGSTPANAVGYRIGDSMIIWHNGILSSVFVGVYAGGGGVTTPFPGGADNTFMGNLSGYHNSIPTTTRTR